MNASGAASTVSTQTPLEQGQGRPAAASGPRSIGSPTLSARSLAKYKLARVCPHERPAIQVASSTSSSKHHPALSRPALSQTSALHNHAGTAAWSISTWSRVPRPAGMHRSGASLGCYIWSGERALDLSDAATQVSRSGLISILPGGLWILSCRCWSESRTVSAYLHPGRQQSSHHGLPYSRLVSRCLHT